MHPQIQRFYDLNRQYTEPRDELMNILSDSDLTYQPSGANPTLGTLCREMGETEYAYIQSLKTFKVDFSYRNDDPELTTSVEKLQQWYKELDDELQAVLETITDEDVKSRQVDRGDFSLPPQIHLDVYREALLIFYGKASVYLKEMEKTMPDLWQVWIG